MAAVREACTLRRDASPRDRQFLFSFYNHPRPNYTEHASDSVLHGRSVPVRIEVRAAPCEPLQDALAWGQQERHCRPD